MGGWADLEGGGRGGNDPPLFLGFYLFFWNSISVFRVDVHVFLLLVLGEDALLREFLSPHFLNFLDRPLKDHLK